MRISSIIILSTLLYGCGNNHKTSKNEHVEIDSTKSNTDPLSKDCIQRDTISQLGIKVHYSYQKGGFQISWGDSSFTRTYDSLYYCYYYTDSGLWDMVPKFYYETKNTVVLRNIIWTSSGANPAPLEYCAIILPKNKIDSTYEKDFFIDCGEDYIAFGDAMNQNIHIVNLETKKKQTVVLSPKPDLSRSPTLSIQATKFKKNSFFIKYESLDKNYDTKTIEKKFKIEI